MIMSEVQQRTDDVTSAGVMSLGIMSATDRFGATPNADAFLHKDKIIRTHIRTGRLVLLCWYKNGLIRLREN